MRVSIDSWPVTATLQLSRVPRDKWLDLMRVRRDYMQTRLGYDCRCLFEFVGDAQEMYAELGFKSPDDMIRQGYELSPEMIRLATELLRLSTKPMFGRRSHREP
jgi:hypothetical protein